MHERPVVTEANKEAVRAGHTGDHLRYILIASCALVIIAFIAIALFVRPVSGGGIVVRLASGSRGAVGQFARRKGDESSLSAGRMCAGGSAVACIAIDLENAAIGCDSLSPS